MKLLQSINLNETKMVENLYHTATDMETSDHHLRRITRKAAKIEYTHEIIPYNPTLRTRVYF